MFAHKDTSRTASAQELSEFPEMEEKKGFTISFTKRVMLVSIAQFYRRGNSNPDKMARIVGVSGGIDAGRWDALHLWMKKSLRPEESLPETKRSKNGRI